MRFNMFKQDFEASFENLLRESNLSHHIAEKFLLAS